MWIWNKPPSSWTYFWAVGTVVVVDRCGGQKPNVSLAAIDMISSGVLKQIKPVTRGYRYGFLGGTKACTRTCTLELPMTLPTGISIPVTIPTHSKIRVCWCQASRVTDMHVFNRNLTSENTCKARGHISIQAQTQASASSVDQSHVVHVNGARRKGGGHLEIGNYAVVYAIKLRRQRPRFVMPY